MTDYLSVLDYGAVGDGSTDDRAAIQACIDAATASGKWVLLPFGHTYRIDQAPDRDYSLLLPTGAELRGGGATSVLYSTAVYPIRIAAGADDVRLYGFALDSHYATSFQAGIFIASRAHSGLNFESLRISNMRWAGIVNTGGSTVTRSTFKSLTIVNSGDFGIHINGGGSYITIDSCVIDGVEGVLYPPHCYYFKQSDHLTVVDCIARNSNRDKGRYPNNSGFDFDDVTDSTVTRCDAQGCTYGIAVNRYPSTGCRDIAFYASGGSGNNLYDRFEYGANHNITWDSACYGTYRKR
jgi:hypothetical protein